MQILSNLSVSGLLGLNSVADANTDTDKFLVLDSSGIVRYRTGAELYSDIGAGAVAAYTSVLQHTVKAGEDMTKGQAVYVSSADGTNMIVSKASNASEQTSSKTLGVIAQNMLANDQGFVVTEGLLSGIDTSNAAAGDPVWLGTNGNLLFGLLSKPYAPAHLVFIGIVTRAQQNNGEIFVKVQNGFELNELHNVQITTTPSDNTVLSYEYSSALYKMKSIPTILGYTPADSERTLTINGTSYNLNVDRTWNVGTTTGSGASGQVAYWNGTTSQTGSSSLFWDATLNRLGVGLNNPQRKVEIYSTNPDSHLRISGSAPSVSLGEAITGSIYQAKFGLATSSGHYSSSAAAGDFVIISQTGATIWVTGTTDRLRLNYSGNFSIGNTNDTYKLDVSGTGRFTSNLYTSTALYINTTAAYGFRINSEGDNGFYNRGGSTASHYPFLLENSSGSLLFQIQGNGVATFGSSSGSGLRVYGGSGTNQWDVYLNSTNLRFSDNTGTGSVIFDRPISGTSATFSNTVTATEFILDNGTADGGQLVLASSGYSNWNIDNYSGSLRAYYGSTEFIRLMNNGQLRLNTYTSSSSWTGTSVATLGVDSSGNVITLSSSGSSQWVTSGSDIYYNTGIVGIGLTTGFYGKLSVSSGNFNGVRIDTNAGYDALSIGGTGALAVDAPGIQGGRFYVANGGNVGIGTSSPLSLVNNSGLHINRGGHTMLMLGSGNTHGGVLQSSDDTLRMFMGANIYDDVSNSWSQFVDARGYAAFDAISGDTSGLARILVGNPNQSGYSGANIFFEGYADNSNSYIKFRTVATDNVLYLAHGGNVGVGTSSPGARLTVQGSDNSYGSGIRWQHTSSGNYIEAIHGSSNTLYWGYNGNTFLQMVNNSSFNILTTNVGIGTTGPTHQLSISRSSQSADYQININSEGGISDGNFTGIRFSQDSTASTELGNIRLHYFSSGATALSLGTRYATQAIYIDNTTNGKVGIGTTSPNHRLDVNGDINIPGGNKLVFNNEPTGWYIHARTTTSTANLGAALKNMIISGGGSTEGFAFTGVGTGAASMEVRNDGRVWVRENLNVGGTITESSTIKIKENIIPIASVLNKVELLNPVIYNKKGSTTTEIGLIAEEVFDVYPEFVLCDSNGNPIGVHYSRLTAVLIESVKELKKEIDILKQKN